MVSVVSHLWFQWGGGKGGNVIKGILDTIPISGEIVN